VGFWYGIMRIGFIMHKFVKLQKAKRKRKHGFLKRASFGSGRKILKRRKDKKRKRLGV